MSDAKLLDTDGLPFSSTKNGTKRSLDVSVTDPKGAFGEIQVFVPNPQSQIDSVYGLRSLTDVVMDTDVNSSGSVTVSDRISGREFIVSTGTDTVGSSEVLSRRYTRYRPGQGNNYRFTGRFTTGVTNSTQKVGALNQGNEVAFGYNGPTFGIFQNYGGRPEMQRMTITAGAGAGETATINLDGTSFTVSLTAGNPTHTAFEIAAASFTGWRVEANDKEINFVSKTNGNLTGVFNFTSGGGAAAATFAEIAAGQSMTVGFVSQSAWNIQKLNTTTSDFVLDPTKGNVYQTVVQYLGYGMIKYQVEEPDTGMFVDVHSTRYSNANTGPSLDIPIFRVGARVKNSGNSTNLTTAIASGAGLTDGKFVPFRNPRGHVVSITGLTTTLTNVLAIRNNLEFNQVLNLSEVFPSHVDVAVEGTKPAECAIMINPTFGGEPNWTLEKADVSCVSFSESAVTLTPNGSIVNAFALAKSGSHDVDLRKLRVDLAPGDILAVGVKASAGTTDSTVGVTWLED
jgi:hypothetical protein